MTERKDSPGGECGCEGYQQINTNKQPRPYSYLQTGFQRTRLNTPQAAADGQDDSGWFLSFFLCSP